MAEPTAEQVDALKKFRTGRPLKITAFAGTGKTATLKLLANSNTARGLYLAFNKAIADEAKTKFPDHVACSTTHSLAWRALQGSRGFSSDKMKDAIQPKHLVELIGLPAHRTFGSIQLQDVHLAFLILRTMRRFCQSASPAPTLDHVPQYGRLLGVDRDLQAEVRHWVLAQARSLWKRMTDPRDRMPLGHDGYLKLWTLDRPDLGFDYILLDEAQDTNPVVLELMASQRSQIVYVGDRYQQIYEWRGAINAMDKIRGCKDAYLTKSFRFGTTLADAASKVLRTLGERRAMTGNPSIATRICKEARTRAVLARTNGVVMSELLTALESGVAPHVVGGTAELKRLLGDAFALKDNRPGSSPEFFGFTRWADVQDFAGTEEGEELRPVVKLVDRYGERTLWKAVSQAHDREDTAGLVISTAHKAKGREWDSVRIASDFVRSRRPDTDIESEARLFYVAMTRAKRTLAIDPAILSAFTEGSRRATSAHERARPTLPQSVSPDSALPPRSDQIVVRDKISERRRHPAKAPPPNTASRLRPPASPPPSKKGSLWRQLTRFLRLG